MDTLIKSQTRLLLNKSFKYIYPEKFCKVFIHIPKNAGLSIRDFFYGHQLKILIIGHNTRSQYYCYPHRFLSEGDASAFCIVRNPYDRVSSCYSYLYSSSPFQNDKKDAEKWCLKYPDFERFVKEGLTEFGTSIFDQLHFKPQLKWIQKPDGRLIVQQKNILHFENLEEDLYAYLDRNQMPYEKTLKKLNQSRNADYRSLYDNEMIDIVSQLYSQDISVLGYEF